MNNSSPLDDCDLIIPDTATTTESIPPDKTTPITNSETVSPQFKGDLAILTSVTVVFIVLFITATVICIFTLIVCRSQKSRNSTQNKMHNTNEAHTTALDLVQNDAYQAIEKKDAIILNDNDAYESAAANGAHATTIPLAENDAYNVIERKDAVVTGQSNAYEAVATLSGLVDEQNMYEII